MITDDCYFVLASSRNLWGDAGLVGRELRGLSNYDLRNKSPGEINPTQVLFVFLGISNRIFGLRTVNPIWQIQSSMQFLNVKTEDTITQHSFVATHGLIIE